MEPATDISFNPHDPSFVTVGVPTGVLARLRAECPVYKTPSGSWYVARHDDVEAVLKDVDTFVADLSGHSRIDGLDKVPAEERFLSEISEPRHGKIRRLFNSCFASHRVREHEEGVVEICNRLVDAMLVKPVADLHGDYALRIPALVMARIMGLGPEAEPNFSEWSHDGTLMLRPSTPGMPEGGPAIQAYFEEYMARQRALPEPDNHVFKVMLSAEVDGVPLTDREIATQLHFMIQAGVHTTRSLVTHAVHRLLQSPTLFEELRADRSLVARFVEESLRHDSPVFRTTRRCQRDIDFGGVRFEAGQAIEVGIASGNLDEAHYPLADEFRLDRDDPRDHLGFGAGSHVCPGATLARLEATTAIEVLLDRVAAMHTVEGVTYPPIPGSLGHQPIPAILEER